MIQTTRGRRILGAVLLCGTFIFAYGVTPASAVFNADTVSWKDHSQIVQVMQPNGNGQFEGICGGTLIDENWVLTAAHCVTEAQNIFGCSGSEPEAIMSLASDCYVTADHAMALYLGADPISTSSLNVELASGTRKGVAALHVYPGFVHVFAAESPKPKLLSCFSKCARVDKESYFASGDLALLRLAGSGVSNPLSRLASSTALLTDHRAVTAYGWGDTDPGRPSPSSSSLRRSKAGTLRLAAPPLLPGCDSDSSPYVDQISPGMVLCVETPAENGGVGKGDSGGPLYASDVDGKATQIGVTSYGPSIDPATGTGPSSEYPSSDEPDKFASVARLIKWIRSKTGIGETTGSGDDNVATALVIDNSGSMSSNDPALLRREAAKSYANTAVDGDHVGAVGFESSAYEISSIGRMPDTRPGLLEALDSGVFAGGGTDIGSGLAAGCTMLDDEGLPEKRAAILLTDGQGGYGGESTCFAANGWKVFTVGLGSGVNDSLLQEIADDTGGTYQPVPDAASLQCEFEKVRALVAGAEPKPCLADLIQAGETIVKIIEVVGRTAQAVFSTRWPGSDVEMTLVSPSGREIGRNTTDWNVTHDVGPTSETYVVKVPEPGEWKVKLYGAEVDPDGEPVVLGTSAIPFSNELPILSPAADATAGASPLTVNFNANATDPDGTVEQVLWDFGDGASEAGQEVTHTYTSPGRYTPQVTAIDDEGEPSTEALSEVVVSGDPPVADFDIEVAGEKVIVDASPSTDPDSSIVRYAWDFDDDDEPDVEETGPTATWSYEGPGQKQVVLGVESAQGEFAQAVRVVSIAPGGSPSGDGESGGRSSGDAFPVPGIVAHGVAVARIGVARAARVAIVRGGRALLNLRCRGGTRCVGVIKLTRPAGRRGQAHRGKGRSSRRRRQLLLGRTKFDIPAAGRRTVRIVLNRRGRRLMRGKRRLVAKLVGRNVAVRRVVLRR